MKKNHKYEVRTALVGGDSISHPCIIAQMLRPHLTRADIDTIKLLIRDTGKEAYASILKDEKYIGMVIIRDNDVWKHTSIKFEHRHYTKNQWRV